MRRSPFHTILYCSAVLASLAIVLTLSGIPSAWAQVSRSAKVDKGPRALGLLQLPPNGKGHLIPICIMIDGKFYDASAYKASPVPMALWSETEYDVVKTGISQGLFTVTGALENNQTHAWMAEGRFQTAAELTAQAKKQPVAPSKPRGLDEDSGPPVLRHSGAKQPAPPEPKPQTTTAPSTPAPASNPAPASTSSAPNAPTPNSEAASAQTSADLEDPNRPTLKRGKQSARPEQPETSPSTNKAAPKNAPSAKASAEPKIQLIPAISDGDGPEPRNYAFEMKTTEEQDFQRKMQTLAQDAVRSYEKKVATDTISALPQPATHRAKSTAKAPSLSFSNTELRVFDLTNSNDAVLVYSASTEGSQALSPTPESEIPRKYFVTLVARQDLNGNLHQILSSVTDNQHLDVEPRWEMIDAVDANGDGAGELLFRKVSDSGIAFAVYRVIGDQLYPIFEGTPGQ